MTRSWRILHLTDLHIADPKSPTEHLREGHYREYIDGLVAALINNDVVTEERQLDAIVVTGDVVDRGHLDNYSHAASLLRYLSTNLGIPTKHIYICNGNHDIDRDSETKRDYVGARQGYENFAKEFGNGQSHISTSRFSLIKTQRGFYVLTIDSTIGSDGEDRAGDISVPEIDAVINAVRDSGLGINDLLLVASHHPPSSALRINGPFDETDGNWFKQHIWAKGNPLLTRLERVFEGPILWLSGDIHKAEYVIDDNVHSAVTGRFGCSTSAPHTQVRRQARVIVLPQQGETSSWLAEYVPEGHVDHPQAGNWNISEAKPEKHTRPKPRQHHFSRINHCTITASVNGDDHTEFGIQAGCNSEQQSNTDQIDATPMPRLLSSQLQANIIRVIAEKQIYVVGRFITSEDQSTLAWVPMGSLLDQGELLANVVSEMSKWLTKTVEGFAATRPLIIGIDSWGAIMASQLSVSTGIKNFCIAGRAKGITHTASERVSPTVIAGVKESDLVILVSDVIGTGHSLQQVHYELTKDLLASVCSSIRWGLLSIICDETHHRGEYLNFACTHATACKDLRMPIIDNTKLPGVDVFPADISFMRP